jgi:hypothetical protein
MVRGDCDRPGTAIHYPRSVDSITYPTYRMSAFNRSNSDVRCDAAFRKAAANTPRATSACLRAGIGGRRSWASSASGPGSSTPAPGGDKVAIPRLHSATKGHEPIDPTCRPRSGQAKLGLSATLTVVNHLSAIQGLPEVVSLYDGTLINRHPHRRSGRPAGLQSANSRRRLGGPRALIGALIDARWVNTCGTLPTSRASLGPRPQRGRIGPSKPSLGRPTPSRLVKWVGG